MGEAAQAGLGLAKLSDLSRFGGLGPLSGGLVPSPVSD